jgi:hypothetical protein
LVSVQPTVPETASLSVKVDFNKATPVALNMIVWTQLQSEVLIHGDKSVGVSFYNVFNAA